MFILICALILAFQAILCQSELATIKLDEINNLVGIKATNSGDIPIDNGTYLVRKNNEIELFLGKFNFNKNLTGPLKFLTKINDRLQFGVRHNQSSQANDANDCRLKFASKYCNVTNTATSDEYYVECRQTFNSSEPILRTKNWRIWHDEKDRYQIDGWEKEDYPIFAKLLLKYEYKRSRVSKNCSYSIVFNFNSQLDVEAKNNNRKGNRDYVLLAKRDDVYWEYREEWFTRRKPQPSSRKHWPYGLRVPKKRWTFPKKPIVEFMKDKQ